MSEKFFAYCGVALQAVTASKGSDGLIGCDGCYFYESNRDCQYIERPRCNKGDRIDGIDVIFVEEQ